MNNIKKIAVFFEAENVMDAPFDELEYWKSYQELADEIIKQGAEFYIVRSQSTYLGEGVFEKSWQFKDGKLIECGKVKIDALYDKGSFVTDRRILVLNNEEINEICTNKWQTYQLFPQYFPKTILVHTKEQLDTAINEITTSNIVVKPVNGAEGKDVFIGDHDYIMNAALTYPCLVQEFINSSMGIAGLVEGLHDFRIALINGEIVYSFLRTPPPKSLVANVAQGGNQISVDIDKIPKEALELIHTVDSYLSKFGPRFYGIDIAMSPNGFKIIELNSRLGLDENCRDKIFIKVKKAIAKLLLELANNSI